MKILLYLLFVPVTLIGQTKFWNTTCGTASFISPIASNIVTTTSNQPGCSGTMKVYYYYHSLVTAGSAVSFINYTTSTSSTYKVYGPFANVEDGCTAIPSSLLASSSSASTSQSVSHTSVQDKFYILEVTVNACSWNMNLSIAPGASSNFSTNWKALECIDCIPGFRPTAGTYVISAWVKDANSNATVMNYSNPYLSITTDGVTSNFTAQGEIIDGWQRIEDTIQILVDFDFFLTLKCGSTGDCYFDDIRIFPKDGSMMTYVYDPKTLRLMAELDERNYAKLYEYDEEGKLIRVKKETERGVMTIQETRENNSSK